MLGGRCQVVLGRRGCLEPESKVVYRERTLGKWGPGSRWEPTHAGFVVPAVSTGCGFLTAVEAGCGGTEGAPLWTRQRVIAQVHGGDDVARLMVRVA